MRRALPTAAAAVVVAAGLVAAPAQAATMPIPQLNIENLAEGFPPFTKALDVAPDGSVIVGASSGEVTRYVVSGAGAGTSSVVTQLEAPIIDLAVGKDRAWILTEGGDVWVWRLGQDAPQNVGNVISYQASDPDPHDLEGIPDESNPFGITVHPDGSALLADAAGNDLLKVGVDGDFTTMARFPVEVVATDHLEMPPGEELPPEMPTESVPTTVAVGPDGAIYVGELKGFPFRPGSSRIWRIDADASDVDCSAEATQGDCYTAETGYTGIADLDIHSSGAKLVMEYAADGVMAFEGGFETGEFPPAVLRASYQGQRVELAEGEFSQPGAVAFFRNKAFVLDGLITGGRLSRLL